MHRLGRQPVTRHGKRPDVAQPRRLMRPGTPGRWIRLRPRVRGTDGSGLATRDNPQRDCIREIPWKRLISGAIQRICVDIPGAIRGIFGFMKRGAGGGPRIEPVGFNGIPQCGVGSCQIFRFGNKSASHHRISKSFMQSPRDNPQKAPNKNDFRRRCQRPTDRSRLQRQIKRTECRVLWCSGCHGHGKRAFEKPILRPQR